ncbi:hypothetical protein [Pseudonocardia lacus]|uniref:hypothetical protein n=1 Tax=Pseudonocardia lacus TaxID=2835865 RepID=UPI001BDC0F9B|nr:hypothetical protein [Pseudonocardia lacus]
MGATLRHYPPAHPVLAAHAAHLERQAPTAARYVETARLAAGLAERAPEEVGLTRTERDRLVRRHLALLDREDWCAAGRSGVDVGSDFGAWFVREVAGSLGLRAFTAGPSRSGGEVGAQALSPGRRSRRR